MILYLMSLGVPRFEAPTRWLLLLIVGIGTGLLADYDAYLDAVAQWKKTKGEDPRPTFDFKKALIRAFYGFLAGGAGVILDSASGIS